MFNGQVDIGFSRKDRKLIGRVFPLFAHRKIRAELYARGKEIDEWVDLFAGDDELCTALWTLLEGYAYSIEWAGSQLSARVNVLEGSIDGDATGGEHFFTNLDVVATRLSALGKREKSTALSTTAAAWGPATLRKSHAKLTL